MGLIHCSEMIEGENTTVCKGLRRTNLESWGGGWGGLHFFVVEK